MTIISNLLIGLFFNYITTDSIIWIHIYYPIYAATLGYLPFITASNFCLKSTNNKERTRTILWIWQSFKSSFFLLLGTLDLFQIIDTEILISNLIFGEELTKEIYESVDYDLDEINFWLWNIPVGITGLISAIQVRESDNDSSLI